MTPNPGPGQAVGLAACRAGRSATRPYRTMAATTTYQRQEQNSIPCEYIPHPLLSDKNLHESADAAAAAVQQVFYKTWRSLLYPELV
jgi:hypothetical protein